MKQSQTKAGSPRIALVHPELGIGGAERLMIDAALELQQRGARVAVFTARHDSGCSFEDTRSGILDIRACARFLPLHIAGRLRVPCAVLRMAAAAAGVQRSGEPWDIVLCDLVPQAIPLIRLVSRAKIIFFCHYPDRLLALKKTGLYSLYRWPVNLLEETGLRMADRILVNSRFTESVFRSTFPRLAHKGLEVVYPGIELPGYAGIPQKAHIPAVQETETVILSLNRYDPQKNPGLALEAVAELKSSLSEVVFRQVRLVFAGNCDERLPESRQLLEGLRRRAAELGIAGHITFLESISDAERRRLLQRCACLAYTSPQEHFGIGIVEAMAAGRPVVAIGSGGPLETVMDGETGFLTLPDPISFAGALARIIADPARARAMGDRARKRAEAFSRQAFGDRLQSIVDTLLPGRPDHA